MELALFVDFGSTYTKVTVVDLEREEIRATGAAGTTVESCITVGLEKALGQVYTDIGSKPEFVYKAACSSAAGGLKIVAVGLVKNLTAEAAKRAALGAGSKVLEVFSHQLTREDIYEIEKLSPDIILLAGGTDGGNREVLIYNAGMLSQLTVRIPIVIAGNRVAAPEAQAILSKNNFETEVVENVMPQLNQLNVEPTRAKIREIFFQKLTIAKGLKEAEGLVGGVIMPTPAAVLKAVEVLAQGSSDETGWGDLMALDLGGATTDVYSIGKGEPSKPGIVLKGLEEPLSKRTVEGDLGMRYSAQSILSATANNLPSSLEEELSAYTSHISLETTYLPQTEREKVLEKELAKIASSIAVERHVGRLEVSYTPFGATYFQYGKDLTHVTHLIGTGGILVNYKAPMEILQSVLFNSENSTVLKPQKPQLWLDQSYILAGMGLLAEIDSRKALRIMKKYLIKLGGH
ncbi:uncharacterized protein (TIGR01319 family) [Desulfitispora alkaliphila]|uniref:methylaspartate mutase accessory protein GlmL n=1 Tax=Desulfitispora alkaliphila TaxID=622674 RepID=UPI003D22442E